MIVTTETATVYRGGGRRFFTKKAAYFAEAKARIRRECDCEGWDDDHVTPPYTCGYHSDEERHNKIIRRLVGFYRNADKTQR